jgi:AraC-like DNA-binding protein
MKQILITILFVLATSAAFSNSLQNSQPDKQLPLAEAYSLGQRYVTQQTDSALYYLGLITSRYNESNIGELKEDEQKLVAKSYYYQAGLQAYEKNDYEASVRSLITGEQICNDDTLRYDLQKTLVVALIVLATVMPTDDNLQLANYYTEQNFRKACQLKDTSGENIGYLNLFSFGMDEKTRRRNRWATDMMLKRQESYDIFSIYVSNYCRVIDCLDQKKPAEALALLRTTREKYLPLLDELDLHFKVDNLLSMAYVFQEMGQRDSFYICTRQCEAIARENGYREVLLGVYNDLVTYYDQENNPQQATHYKRLSMDLRDSLFVSGGFDRLLKSGLLDKLRPDEEVSAEKPVQWWPYVGLFVLLALASVAVFFFFVRRRKRSSVAPPQPASDANDSYQGSSLTEERKDAIYQDILGVMADTTIISNPNFTITQLADCIRSNQKYVSQVINERTSSNFNNLLASHRVDEACRRMENTEEFGSLTIEAIGQSVGFGSRASFFNAFKRFRGVAPSEYMKTVRDNNSNSGS